MAALSTVYCTDEDLLVRLGADFAHLCPRDQVIAKGTDGAFSAGSRWLLTSGSTDWTGQGVAAGMVVTLSNPTTTPITKAFSGSGDMLAIDSVSSSGAVLRRRGQTSGIGFPPGPAAGLTGIPFTVATLYPQIELASYDLNRRYGVDPKIPSRNAAAFYDIRETRQACVLTVAINQYRSMARAMGDDKADDFAAKSKVYSQELDDVLARLIVHWQSISGFGLQTVEPSTSRFGMRISR